MRDRLLTAASAVARLVLVVVAFGLAVGSIALSSVRGFCPEVDATAGVALAMPLATIVEEPTLDDPPADPTAPATEEAPAGDEPAEQAPADGACEGGAQRCLPPLWSSILILGETDCHDQAGSRLRSILVPAFVGSTVLLAGAWWLRPSRLHADRHAADTTGR